MPNGRTEDANDEEYEAGGNALLKTGIIGTLVAAICCFTPVLVIGLGAVGLSAWLGWLDYVLLPALAVFAGLTVYAVYRRSGKEA